MSRKDEFNKNNNISCTSLKQNSSFEVWATKQGGNYKSWKRRYFMLVHVPPANMAELYYFKTDKDKKATGVIKLNERSTVKELSQQKHDGRPLLNIDTGINIGKRATYFLFCNSQGEQDKFKKALEEKILSLKKVVVVLPPKPQSNTTPTHNTTTTTTPSPSPTTNPNNTTDPTPGPGGPRTGIKLALETAKNAIPFLNTEDGDKTLEFFQIWTDSIPHLPEGAGSGDITVTLVMTADMSQLSWRVYGPQNVLIQDMVDFFWNVGAPEQEIDRLNEVGGLINPLVIGSWIDMSTKGGMDGGWVFPVHVNITDALKACDEGPSLAKLADWTRTHRIDECITVGRDMGASPPRQTEIRFTVSGNDFEQRFALASQGYSDFGFPPLPGTFVGVLREWNPQSMELSVITSCEGFVRMGMILPNPTPNVVNQLCNLANADKEGIFKFQKDVNIQRPSFVELQFLMDSFGYGVYNEGLNVVFHYNLASPPAAH